MMIVVRIILALLIVLKSSCVISNTDMLAKDYRINTYVYNTDGVYFLTLHYGFHSIIEFSKNERIKTVRTGREGWFLQTKKEDNRLFINPIAANMKTNMTIITNLNRVYMFDVVSKNLDQDDDNQDLVYLIRFKYPKKLNKLLQEVR